jgi:hypothetical protein
MTLMVICASIMRDTWIISGLTITWILTDLKSFPYGENVFMPSINLGKVCHAVRIPQWTLFQHTSTIVQITEPESLADYVRKVTNQSRDDRRKYTNRRHEPPVNMIV